MTSPSMFWQQPRSDARTTCPVQTLTSPRLVGGDGRERHPSGWVDGVGVDDGVGVGVDDADDRGALGTVDREVVAGLPQAKTNEATVANATTWAGRLRMTVASHLCHLTCARPRPEAKAILPSMGASGSCVGCLPQVC